MSASTPRRPSHRRSLSADGDAIRAAISARGAGHGYGVWIGARVGASRERSRGAPATGGGGEAAAAAAAAADADAGPGSAAASVGAPLRAKRIGAVGEDRRRSFSDTDLVSSFGSADAAADAAG